MPQGVEHSEALAFAALAAVLVVAGVTDWRWGKIHNRLTYPAALGGLIFWAVASWAGADRGLGAAVVGLLAGLIPFALIYAGGGLGGGDVKLMGAVGAISASWACVLSTAVYAFLLAGVMAAVVMVRRRIVRRTMARLLGAALLAAGRVKPDLPNDSPTVPLGLAIAIGGIVAGGEQLLGWSTPWRWLVP
ncbi:MAG TPA: A24 family peptidase [Phycisphaeraceae bacterium]